jgi:DNA polymerase delta subunit OB-fold domain
VYVSKVLDVEAGKLCYIIGTVYMDMPLKPNILEDITKEVSVGGGLKGEACYFKKLNLSPAELHCLSTTTAKIC